MTSPTVMDPLPKLKIRQINIRSHAHATESVDKVKAALKNILSLDFEEKMINIEHLTGSFGNPIRVITINLVVQEYIKSFIANLNQFLPEEEKSLLCKTFPDRIDEKMKFYFRLDKQGVYQKNIKLASNSDIIQIVISVQNKTPNIEMTVENVKPYFQKLGIIK